MVQGLRVWVQTDSGSALKPAVECNVGAFIVLYN